MQYMKKMIKIMRLKNIILKIRSKELHGVNVTVPFKNISCRIYGHS